MKLRMHWAALAAAAAVLTACGGGGSDTTPAAPVTSVKVFGDSLADSGTFGMKFTVQGTAATGAGSTPIWPELPCPASRAPRTCMQPQESEKLFCARATSASSAMDGKFCASASLKRM